MWTSIEPKISSLVDLDTAKQVWAQAREMFYGIGNMRRTYNLHWAFFYFYLEDFFGKLHGICKEIDLSALSLQMLLR